MKNAGKTAMRMKSSSNVLMPPWCLKTYKRTCLALLPALMVETSLDWNLYQTDIMMPISLINKAIQIIGIGLPALPLLVLGTTSIFNVALVTQTTICAMSAN